MSYKILLVEDEQTILDSLAFSLGKEGCAILTASSGQDALAVFERDKPDAILLDLTLGHVDGFAVLREVRLTSQLPVIILTARDDETDTVCALG